jgi:hypothetical protein
VVETLGEWTPDAKALPGPIEDAEEVDCQDEWRHDDGDEEE